MTIGDDYGWLDFIVRKKAGKFEDMSSGPPQAGILLLQMTLKYRQTLKPSHLEMVQDFQAPEHGLYVVSYPKKIQKHMEVSINGGTQQWVDSGKSYGNG